MRGGEDHADRAVGSSVLNQLVSSLSDVPWRMYEFVLVKIVKVFLRCNSSNADPGQPKVD